VLRPARVERFDAVDHQQRAKAVLATNVDRRRFAGAAGVADADAGLAEREEVFASLLKDGDGENGGAGGKVEDAVGGHGRMS